MDQPHQNQPPLRSDFIDDADMAELIEYYVAELPRKIESIGEYVETNRLDELRRIAHQIKGASGSYGFGPVGELAEHIVRAIDADCELESIHNSVESLVAMCRRVSV
jgi:histidine phosphotransfer protein HptB